MRVADSSSAAAVAERAQPTTGMPEAANASTHAAVAYVFPDPGRPATGCSASAPGRHTARTMAICSGDSSGRAAIAASTPATVARSEEHTSELQSLMRISYAVFCLKKKTIHTYTYLLT